MLIVSFIAFTILAEYFWNFRSIIVLWVYFLSALLNVSAIYFRFDKADRSLILPIIKNNGINRYPLDPFMIRRNSVLNNPVAPPIFVRG